MEAPRPARPMQGQSSIYPQADKGERSGGYGTLLTDADLAPERETAKEPHKWWRNRYRNERKRPFRIWSGGVRVGVIIAIWEPGSTNWAPLVRPSLDVAETIGRRFEAKHRGLIFLGAFPVDESGEPL